MDSVNSKTRQRILRVALKIFAECGYKGASVQAIVDAARVTKPTLYYYFKNKAALFQSLHGGAFVAAFGEDLQRHAQDALTRF